MLSHLNKIWSGLTGAIADTVFFLSHKVILPLRYKVEVKGAEYLKPKNGNKKLTSTLFLANHSSHLDATFISYEFIKRRVPFIIWALDRTFKLPYLRWAARHVLVVKVPNISEIRSMKHLTKLHKLITRTADGLKGGNNYLIFPAGRVKEAPNETIDGKSAVPLIIQQCPEVNIILIRMTGLWGCRFSGSVKEEMRWGTPAVGSLEMFWYLSKLLLYNGLFFVPKRKIVIEFVPAPDDFPRFGTRLEICRYLENFYNQEWGPQGEPLYLVPEYFWKESYYFKDAYQTKHYIFHLDQVSKPIRNAVVKLVADKVDLDVKDIGFEMQLGRDLGFDSLDLVEILTILESQYGIKRIAPQDVTTVGHLIAIAAKIPIATEKRPGLFHRLKKPLSRPSKISTFISWFLSFFNTTS